MAEVGKSAGAGTSRPPAVAGRFYPAPATELAATVDALLAAARPTTGEPLPKALIVPHAGYVYSGPVAASAYARLRGDGRPPIERVVLIGPAHRVYVEGLASSGAAEFQTPLGAVTVDGAALDAIPGVTDHPAAHAREHSLEVQLPFLQRLLPETRIVPLVVSDAGPVEVAEVIEALWGGRETLVVVSSDLSHYLAYAVARALDGETARRIVALDEEPIESERACGAAAINGLVRVARRKELRPRLLDLRSSGDTAGGREEVVGYGAFAFYEP